MPLVEVTREPPLATLTLNRPEARNALSRELCQDLVVALHGLSASGEIRVLVVRGEGPAFCAGADIAAVSGPSAIEFLAVFEEMLEALARVALPTIAQMHGAALGGGLQLATACDFRIAASDCVIGIPAARLGIVVNFENIQRLVLLAGVPTAKEVLMTARTYSGEEAVRAGLLTRAVPAAELDDAVRSFAGEIAALAPLSVQGAKRALQVVSDYLGGARAGNRELAGEVDRLVEEAYRSEDLAEGVRALAEKRAPRFRGG